MSNARAGTPIPDDNSNPNTPTTPQVAAPIVVADNRVLSQEQLIAIRTKFYQHGHTPRTLFHKHYHRSELDVMLVRDTTRTQMRKIEVEKEKEREREKLHYGQLQKLLDKERKLVQASLDSVKSRGMITRERTVTTRPADNTATAATSTTTTSTPTTTTTTTTTTATTKDQPTKQRAKPLTRSAPRSPYLLNTPAEEPTTQPTTAPEAVKDNNPGDVASTPVAPRRRGKPLTRSAARSPYLLESAEEEESVATTVKYEGGTDIPATTQQPHAVANIEDPAPASVPSVIEATRRRAKPLTRSAPKSPYLLESPTSEPGAVTSTTVAVKVTPEADMVIPETIQQTAQPQAQVQTPRKNVAKPLARTESVANLEDPATTLTNHVHVPSVAVAPQFKRRAKPLTRSAPPSPYLLHTPTEENSEIAGHSEVSTTSSQQQQQPHDEASAQVQTQKKSGVAKSNIGRTETVMDLNIDIADVKPSKPTPSRNVQDNAMGPPVIPQGRAKSLKRSASMISVDDSDSGSSSSSAEESSSTKSSSESKSDYPPPSKSRKIREGPYSKKAAKASRRTGKKEVTDTDEPKPTPIPEDYLNRFWPSVESTFPSTSKATMSTISDSPPSKPIYRTGIIKATEPELEAGFYVYRPGYGNWFKVFIAEHEFYEDPDEYDVRYIFPTGYTEKEREVVSRREYVVVMKGTGRYVACGNPVEEEE